MDVFCIYILSHVYLLCNCMCMVVYYVVMEANLSIMLCRHDTYPSRHFAGCCLYPDRLEFYRIKCVITLPHFGCTMSTCDDMSAK